MIKTMFLLPEQDNSGVDWEDDKLSALETVLLDAFGGYTVDGLVHGAWRSPYGKEMRDSCIRYVVALDSIAKLSAWVDLIHDVLVDFDQQAIYVEVAGIPEIINRRK